MEHFRKIIPNEFRAVITKALSYYPELAGTPIQFKISENSLFPYASRPLWFSLLNRKNRKYIIIIDNFSKKYEEILLKNLPSDAQIGILGHELAHTLYYENSNLFKLIMVGVLYFIPPFRKYFERNTDKFTISKGLKIQLYEYALYVRRLGNFKLKYNWIDKYYLSPQEILLY